MEEEEKPQLPLVPANLAPNTIKLGDLIDFAVQQVFHEITVLSELLPKKLDADRKVSLVQFAHNTRMLFVKLLALVKWVKSSKKFDQCTAISYFLEQQSQLLLDSADRLYHIREEMTYARLPPFQLSEAIDTLTLGSYTRLPMCIKESFIKKTKLKPMERAQILGRLNQILQTRLSRESLKMSHRIKHIRIRNGYVTLVVPGEFEVQLTVLGEKLGMPWVLLNIKMLVEDFEIGYGSQLVHPLQMNLVHLELQKRLEQWQKEHEDPLSNMYKFLHRFAQSLQLDVLWCQATQLGAPRGQYAERILIERYDPKARILTIGYWLKKILARPGSTQFRIAADYRVSIIGTDDDGPLKVIHSPAYPALGELDERSGRLSVDRLLADTFVMRAKERLLRIRKRIEAAEPKIPIAFLGQAVPFLRMPLLRDSITCPQECLSISINLYSGKVLCDLTALNKEGRDELRDLEIMLYDDFKPCSVMKKLLDKFKIQIMIERYKRAIASLPVKVISEAQMAPFFKDIRKLPTERLSLQFIKEESYFVVITFDPSPELSLKLGFYLISVIDERAQLIDLTQVPDVFASLKRMIKLEELGYNEDDDYDILINRRRENTSAEKQLIYGIATVDDRLGILRVKQELEKRGIHWIAMEEEKQVGGLVLNIPNLSLIPEIKSEDFARHVACCTVRLDTRSRGSWQLEVAMQSPPLYRNTLPKYKKPPRISWITELKGTAGDAGIVPTIIDRLVIYSNIYDIVKKFSKVYHEFYSQHCTILAFTYFKLVLAYGKDRDMVLILTFQKSSQDQNQSRSAIDPNLFKLSFGCLKRGIGEKQSRTNPHTLMAEELKKKFNKSHDLLELVNHLILTIEPLVLIHNYYRIRLVNIRPYCTAMNLTDVVCPLISKSCLSVVNRTTVRLSYGDVHLEIAMLMDSMLAIRDASRGSPKAAGLFELLSFYEKKGETTLVQEERDEGLSPMFSQNVHSMQNPHSVGNTLQVPSIRGEGSSPSRSPGQATSSLTQLVGTRRLITTSLETFSKVLSWNPVEGKTRLLSCAFEDHLNNLCFIQKVTNIMEQFKNGQGHQTFCSGMQIRDVFKDMDHVKVTFPSLGNNPSMISFYMFLDRLTFALRVKIAYTADEPSEENLTALQRYAEEKVVQTFNEMAICSFIMFLRLTPYQGINSIVPYLSSPNVIFPMIYKVQPNQANPATPNAPSWNYSTGFVVRDGGVVNFAVIFIQSVNPQQDPFHQPPQNMVPQRRVMRVVYSCESNTIRSGNPSQEDAMFEQINKEAAATNQSAVYILVKTFHEKYCGCHPLQMHVPPSSISHDAQMVSGSNVPY